METKELNKIADYLKQESIEICALNECTEDDHHCESYAYFDYDKKTKEYALSDICAPDYATRCYASYICLPFDGDGGDLLDELENNLLEEYWDEKE
jgi:hypothetical protein